MILSYSFTKLDEGNLDASSNVDSNGTVKHRNRTFFPHSPSGVQLRKNSLCGIVSNRLVVVSVLRAFAVLRSTSLAAVALGLLTTSEPREAAQLSLREAAFVAASPWLTPGFVFAPTHARCDVRLRREPVRGPICKGRECRAASCGLPLQPAWQRIVPTEKDMTIWSLDCIVIMN